MADIKTKPTRASVTAFISALPDATQRKEAKTLLAMFRRVTGEPATMWGPTIIGFGRYHYRYASGHEGEMCRAGFSPRKGNHVLYVLNDAPGQAALLQRLGKYKTGKVCLYVRRLADIDLGVLEKLVEASFRKTWKDWPEPPAR